MTDGRLLPGAAAWWTGRNIRVVSSLTPVHSLYYVETWRHPQNQK